MSQPRKLIAFDIMDTLIYDPWREALSAATGLPADEVVRRRDPGIWPRLERGEITEAVYWDHLRERNIPAKPEIFHQVRRAGYQWLPGMQDLLLRLVAGGQSVVLATNYPVWYKELKSDLLADIDVTIYASCLIGARKPASTYFDHIVTGHSVEYSDLVLIDDAAANTDAVNLLGGIGITHVNATTTKRQLTEMGVL
jgi:HAD superfamily hydrolase (TIGR01509 family)